MRLRVHGLHLWLHVRVGLRRRVQDTCTCPGASVIVDGLGRASVACVWVYYACANKSLVRAHAAAARKSGVVRDVVVVIAIASAEATVAVAAAEAVAVRVCARAFAACV